MLLLNRFELGPGFIWDTERHTETSNMPIRDVQTCTRPQTQTHPQAF